MYDADLAGVLGQALASAIEDKGYKQLTAVQQAVLDPAIAGRDLRITSQTGSGKTIAVGLVVRDLFEGEIRAPRVLVIAPTRELARQFQGEISWLYAPLKLGVASLTGGASYREELRALASHPAVIVGTPGRILDHLESGRLDLSQLGAVVLDEADRMLDLGFRETLEAILAKTPENRRTHLVSATFAQEVLRLASRVQKNAAHVEGTRLGAANGDIDHIVHVVHHDQRLDAIINLLLAHDGKALVFARTRVDVGDLADALQEAGFAVASLSGDMEQRERTRALAAFTRGAVRVMVATDVAARGLDVQDITLVLHVDVPTDGDTYTHRSGRTGRAGRKGTSALVLTPRELPAARRVIGRSGLRMRQEPIPDAEALRRAQDERCIEALHAESDVVIDERTMNLAKELVARGDVERTIARLLSERNDGAPEPRDIAPMAASRPMPTNGRPVAPHRAPTSRPVQVQSRPSGDVRAPEFRAEPRASESNGTRGWATFQVTWGERQGADARRVLAMVCRRGGVGSQDVGSIRVGPVASEVDIATDVAARFAEAARRRDPRDPRVMIREQQAAEGAQA